MYVQTLFPANQMRIMAGFVQEYVTNTRPNYSVILKAIRSDRLL